MISTPFEFTPSDTRLLRLVSRFCGLISFLAAALLVVRLFYLLEAGRLINKGLHIYNYSDNLLELLSVLLPLLFLGFIALHLAQASRSFILITNTSGRDIFHLNAAMSSLAIGFYLIASFLLLSFFRWLVWVDEVHRCLSAT